MFIFSWQGYRTWHKKKLLIDILPTNSIKGLRSHHSQTLYHTAMTIRIYRFNLRLYFFPRFYMSYFPLMWDNSIYFYATFIENYILFLLHPQLKIWMSQQRVNFLCSIKLSSDILQDSNVCKFRVRKLYSIFLISIVLALNRYHFGRHKKIYF